LRAWSKLQKVTGYSGYTKSTFIILFHSKEVFEIEYRWSWKFAGTRERGVEYPKIYLN